MSKDLKKPRESSARIKDLGEKKVPGKKQNKKVDINVSEAELIKKRTMSSYGKGGRDKTTIDYNAISHIDRTYRYADKQRKTVFKAVLDSPFPIDWPDIPKEDQAIILDALCSVLSGIGEYRRQKRRNKESAKFQYKTKVEAERVDLPKRLLTTEGDPMEIDSSQDSNNSTTNTRPPTILSSFIFGINAVTRYLEQPNNLQIASVFYKNIDSNTEIFGDQSSNISSGHKLHLRIIFVSKAEISPYHLYAHLPIMASIYGNVLLVPLPRGAHSKLANATGMKSLSCIGIKANDDPELNSLYELVKGKVNPVIASWLNPLRTNVYMKRMYKSLRDENQNDRTGIPEGASKIIDKTINTPYLSTKIKQLVTTAPIKGQWQLKQKKALSFPEGSQSNQDHQSQEVTEITKDSQFRKTKTSRGQRN
ncbi:hypothetical protein G9A89_019115 [Geosiphon pyriformis]|nr:hypothetical protein G9A89_019115 [Geosiphon pyriformis]